MSRVFSGSREDTKSMVCGVTAKDIAASRIVPAVIERIHQKALEIVRRYKASEVKLINILEEADTQKVHYVLGYSSLFKYATDGLGLSQEVAYIYINIARKSKEVPALKKEIQNGSISVSKAKKITSVINKTNQDHWLTLAKTSSKREIEKQVAAVAPKELVRDKMSYVAAGAEKREQVKFVESSALPDEAQLGVPQRKYPVRVQLQVGISEKLMLKLRRAQDVLSQKRKIAAGLEEVLDSMVDLYLEKNDPLKKAERLKMKGKLQGFLDDSSDIKQVNSSEVDSSAKSSPSIAPRRVPFNSKIKHSVYLKHQGQCSHVDSNGRRCQERRHLEIHHILPVSRGGTNELKNLTLYCFGHHKGEHLMGSAKISKANLSNEIHP